MVLTVANDGFACGEFYVATKEAFFDLVTLTHVFFEVAIAGYCRWGLTLITDKGEILLDENVFLFLLRIQVTFAFERFQFGAHFSFNTRQLPFLYLHSFDDSLFHQNFVTAVTITSNILLTTSLIFLDHVSNIRLTLYHFRAFTLVGQEYGIGLGFLLRQYILLNLNLLLLIFQHKQIILVKTPEFIIAWTTHHPVFIEYVDLQRGELTKRSQEGT